MIILNGSYVFETEGGTEIGRLQRNKTFHDSITGYLIKVRSRYSRWRMAYTLLVDKQELEDLQELFAENVAPMDFIDHRGFSWLTASGSDDAHHAYSTGGEIEEVDLVPTPATPKNYQACDQRWHVPVTIIVSARGLAGNSANAGGGGGDCSMEHATISGTINSSNDTFTVTETYSFMILFRNGIEQTQGTDYTLSGTTITFLGGAIPQTGDTLDGYGVL